MLVVSQSVAYIETSDAIKLAGELVSKRAALQHGQGTIAAAARRPLWVDRPSWGEPAQRLTVPMTAASAKPREFFIQGLTRDGKTFRPSDWAERLAGAMSCFRPEGVQSGIGAFIGYSPYCVPRVINGVKCVIVNEALKGVEPMAWDFVMNFARDNDLEVAEACLVPEANQAVPVKPAAS
jgi:hypothetical protein